MKFYMVWDRVNEVYHGTTFREWDHKEQRSKSKMKPTPKVYTKKGYALSAIRGWQHAENLEVHEYNAGDEFTIVS